MPPCQPPLPTPTYLSTAPVIATVWFTFTAGLLIEINRFFPSAQVFAEVLHESFNFFYVNIGLAAAGLSPVPSIAENPVSEALFNFVCAW